MSQTIVERLRDPSTHTCFAATINGCVRCEAASEIERLENLCLDDDNYRCEGCERVFGVDDIVFGDDCELCVTCVKEIAEAHA